jgi:hypothetical protein
VTSVRRHVTLRLEVALAPRDPQQRIEGRSEREIREPNTVEAAGLHCVGEVDELGGL